MQPITPILYLFTFLYDQTRYKVHGLWPEEYAECPECSYPSCCDMAFPYSEPEDPTGFIAANWYNSTSTNSCFSEAKNEVGFASEAKNEVESEAKNEVGFANEAKNEVESEEKISLFEHEYIKHGACIKGVNTSTDYLNLVIDLYDVYYNETADQLCSFGQLWISLDEDFQWLGYQCK